MPENKIYYGLKNVHIAFIDNPTSTPPTWKTPIPIPGAVNFKPKSEGQEVKIYADDGVYFTMTTNEGYTAGLEMQAIGDSILAEMLGWSTDTNGMVIEDSDGIQKEFALMFQVTGDVRNKKFVYYSCKASRPETERKTKGDKLDPGTDTLNVVITPIEIDGKNIVKGGIELNETNAAAYNAFYSQVVLPNAIIGAVIKTTLAAVIALAGKLDQPDYTPTSWTSFQAALASATTINASGTATQYEVNNATSTLKAAIVDLVAV